MKKLVMLVVAVAFVFSFLPKAEAGDSAQLGLKVAFDLSYPQEIDTLARAVDNHAFDINGDGIIDESDYTIVKDTYVLAEKYQACLPVEIFKILDVNFDGKIDSGDGNLVTQEVRVYWIASDLGQLRGKADKAYQEAVDSGAPDIIKAAIDYLSKIHGEEVKPRIAQLEELAAARPDLQQLINDVRDKAIGLLATIDDYIARLSNILYPLRLWTEPEAPFYATEGDKLQFNVIAEDLHGVVGDIVAYGLPEGAEFLMDDSGPGQRRNGIFTWTTKAQLGEETTYHVTFYCRSDSNGDGASDEEAKITVNVVIKPLPVISIELVDRDGPPATWELTGMRLNDKRDNSDASGTIIHRLINKGVAVKIEMGYGPIAYTDLRPGMVPDVDVYATEVEVWDNSGFTHWNMIPPNEWVLCAALPAAGPEGVSSCPLHLGFMSPTGLTKPVTQLGVTYEFRAYKAE